jgi:alkanesulfonate monooxygenase SsuD/methylene tetrahydromethanopterin reductase-like flavin-dependent oxidoreductase (luciferase family)
MSEPSLGIGLPLAGQGDDPAAFVAELIDEVEAAEAAGFDLCLVPEHHHGPRTSIVAPLTLSAAIAATTSRIRVGPGVLVLPVHHPVHVAEQLTMIDQLAPGRALLGVGTGYQPEDFAEFGVDPAERGRRTDAALDELRRLLGPEGITPPPSVRPPVWVGAWSKVGLRRAAERADGWIADPIRTISEAAEMAERYRELAGPEGTVVVMREAFVDDGPDPAAAYAPIIGPVFRYYRRHGAAELPEDFAALAEDRFVIGSAAECAAQVREIAARTGADAVVLTLRQPGGPSHEAVLAGIAGLGAAWRQSQVVPA